MYAGSVPIASHDSTTNRSRQYHSTALLLPDGRVLSAGGGVCGGCDAAGYLNPSRDDWTSPTLLVSSTDGSDPRILARGEAIEFPRWSPTGSMIAFA